MKRRYALEAKLGDLSLKLICAPDDPAQASAMQNKASNAVAELLRSPQIASQLIENRAFEFDEKKQNEFLFSRSTCHALRRNFCTMLYTFSGVDTKDIYRQMGHSNPTYKLSSANAPTKEECRKMCLQKHVQPTLFHSPHSLVYDANGDVRHIEVPACSIKITLPPHSFIDLELNDTEPGNTIRITHDGGSVEELYQKESENVSYSYALSASEKIITIVDERKLFE